MNCGNKRIIILKDLKKKKNKPIMAKEGTKRKLQLEAENGKCIHMNSNTKLKT